MREYKVRYFGDDDNNEVSYEFDCPGANPQVAELVGLGILFANSWTPDNENEIVEWRNPEGDWVGIKYHPDYLSDYSNLSGSSSCLTIDGVIETEYVDNKG